MANWSFFKKKRFIIPLIICINVFIFPATVSIPVEGAKTKDWHPKTFWYEPWGPSIVHKGIDIFAKHNTPVLASTDGIRLYQGYVERGGYITVILDRSFRIHYYAHLAESSHAPFWVSREDKIGGVSNTGNAKGKPAHLHYSVFSLFPRPWLIDSDTQGWKKMFYLNPQDLF